MKKISLKALRVKKGLTVEEEAAGLKVSAPTLSSWENGETYPRVDFLSVLEKFYGIKYDSINFFNNQHG